jgi:bifunctional non-homologous end joining protein LigD
MKGVLKSWALPTGIPLARGETRLAVQVEEHPVEYLNFEGTIPEGQYGAGAVMLWDRGTFEFLSKSPSKDFAAGRLHFALSGEKLSGQWRLVRLSESALWLVIRRGKAMRPISKQEDDTSAFSGKTMRRLAAEGDDRQSPRSKRRSMEGGLDSRRDCWRPSTRGCEISPVATAPLSN